MFIYISKITFMFIFNYEKVDNWILHVKYFYHDFSATIWLPEGRFAKDVLRTFFEKYWAGKQIKMSRQVCP